MTDEELFDEIRREADEQAKIEYPHMVHMGVDGYKITHLGHTESECNLENWLSQFDEMPVEKPNPYYVRWLDGEWVMDDMFPRENYFDRPKVDDFIRPAVSVPR